MLEWAIMANRTFAVGDIHGDLAALKTAIAKIPKLDAQDTMILMGDYLDRGAQSAQVIEFIRKELPKLVPGKLICLRGNHEDGWLRVASGGWPEFVIPIANGCLATLRSYRGQPCEEGEIPSREELTTMQHGGFIPDDVVDWMNALPYFYEDEHAIYVHAGLPHGPDGFLHPRDVKAPIALLWCRDLEFFENYRGKLVVFGHTGTQYLPPELSGYTPEDPDDLWAGEACCGLDTGCGKGGFLTALELPSRNVYESR